MKRWAVYFTIDPKTATAMRSSDPTAPVFCDAGSQWWGERVAQRFWLRRSADRFVARENRRRDKDEAAVTAYAARVGELGEEPLPELLEIGPEWRVGRPNLSGWYE